MKKMFAIVLALMLCVSALSVAAFAAPEGIDSLAIVGTGIPGVGEWNPADPAGDMTEVADCVYEKTLEVPAGTTMKFKVAGNDAWDDTCNFGSATIELGVAADMECGGGSGDMTLTVDEDCTIKITVDLNAFATGGAASILVEKVTVDEPTETPDEPTETPDEPTETPDEPADTGDMGIAAVSVALLAATAGLIATVSKKKEF